LQLDDIGVHDNFFELGGHSLLVSTLLIAIGKQFDKDISMQNFFSVPTIANLAKIVDGKYGKSAIRKLPRSIAADLDLDGAISASNKLKRSSITQSIFLTGATGFLGVYLLEEFLKNTKADVYCLVRPNSQESAERRLKNTMLQYKLDERLSHSPRLHVMQGDLSQPRLGLSQKHYTFLEQEIDLILHNGAQVHHLLDYDTLRKANVNSTKALLRLATSYKLKAVHYVSTLSSAPIVEEGDRKTILEDFLFDDMHIAQVGNGYAQTKCVSERLLSKARDRGIPVNIYRPSWILGHSVTGISPTKDNHLLQVLAGCVQLGYAPDWNTSLDALPVDVVSKTIVQAIQTRKQNTVFNIHNPEELSWRTLLNWVSKHESDVTLVPKLAWHTDHTAKITETNPLYTLLSIYQQKKANGEYQELPEIGAIVEDGNAQSLLDQMSLHDWTHLFQRYFSCFRETGFIDDKKISEQKSKASVFDVWKIPGMAYDTILKSFQLSEGGFCFTHLFYVARRKILRLPMLRFFKGDSTRGFIQEAEQVAA